MKRDLKNAKMHQHNGHENIASRKADNACNGIYKELRPVISKQKKKIDS